MLSISTYLDRSDLSGIGVFAAEDLRRGRVIWEFRPGIDLVYTAGQWENMLAAASAPARACLRRYSYKSGGLFYLCTDNAQFMNHGGRGRNVGNNSADDTMFAVRDIAAGEELLCDYFEYSDPDDYHLARIPPQGVDELIASRSMAD